MHFVSQSHASHHHHPLRPFPSLPAALAQAQHARCDYIVRRRRRTRPMSDTERQCTPKTSISSQLWCSPFARPWWQSKICQRLPSLIGSSGESIKGSTKFPTPPTQISSLPRRVLWRFHEPLNARETVASHPVYRKKSSSSTIKKGSDFCMQSSFATATAPRASSMDSMLSSTATSIGSFKFRNRLAANINYAKSRSKEPGAWYWRLTRVGWVSCLNLQAIEKRQTKATRPWNCLPTICLIFPCCRVLLN